MSTTAVRTQSHPTRSRQELESAVVRFAGDSGDGMQLTGGRFTVATALAGNDLATFPDFPAEIRAPTGTTFGVSSFQINFGARAIRTAGDAFDVLIAMNPAALKVEVKGLKPGGIVIVDSGQFNERSLRKVGYAANPVDDGSLDAYRVVAIDITKLALESVKPFGLSQKEGVRSRNMWALGLLFWIFGRDRAPTEAWIRQKFAKSQTLADANVAALEAGHAFGETAEIDLPTYSVPPAPIPPGLYRTVTGSDALAYGLLAGARLAGLNLLFASYPITPASSILHAIAGFNAPDAITFQAEDEIAAVCAAIGASYAGTLGITSSSGPGIALKTEAIGLAIATELPLVIIDSQRAGPSTGMPTKTEQSDLHQAVFGRNADSPVVVLAARSPADCFEVAIEAVRLATTYMTPVILLSDGYIANAAEPWLIPSIAGAQPFPVKFRTDPEGFSPFARDPSTFARAWAVPGTPGLEHRIGGLEKNATTGHISYEPENHQRMTELRVGRIRGIAKDIPLQRVEDGPVRGRLAVVGWGSTYGPISRAVSNMRRDGFDVAHIHLRHIWPLPRNLGDLLKSYEQVLVPEMNAGQLVTLLRAEYLVPAESLSKVSGQPFKISEIEAAIRARLA